MFIIGIYAPMGISLLYNFVILGAVVRSMLARVTPTSRIHSKARSSNLQVFRLIIFLSGVLGLTWSFGIFVTLFDHVVFQYIFAILNTLQGVFIFIFHIVRSDEVRRMLVGALTSITKTSKSVKTVDALRMGSKGVKIAPSVESLLRSAAGNVHQTLSHTSADTVLASEKVEPQTV